MFCLKLLSFSRAFGKTSRHCNVVIMWQAFFLNCFSSVLCNIYPNYYYSSRLNWYLCTSCHHASPVQRLQRMCGMRGPGSGRNRPAFLVRLPHSTDSFEFERSHDRRKNEHAWLFCPNWKKTSGVAQSAGQRIGKIPYKIQVRANVDTEMSLEATTTFGRHDRVEKGWPSCHGSDCLWQHIARAQTAAARRVAPQAAGEVSVERCRFFQVNDENRVKVTCDVGSSDSQDHLR
jgi:hypothetical protein